jgi:homoserine dehydrogenase
MLMRTFDLALIGFGGVTRALARLLVDNPRRFDPLGFRVRVTAISDLVSGSLVQPKGIDLAAVLAMPAGATFAAWPGGSASADVQAVIRTGAADVLVEATFTNPVDGEPAASHIRWALEAGMHVATTNKGPIALHGAELRRLATEHGRHLAYEGSVLSGTPVLGLVRTQLPGHRLESLQGILNGTSNYVLSRMEEGASLPAAVEEAQHQGFAEADPSADLGGSDVRLKVVILANELLGAHLTPDDVPTQGINDLDPAEVAAAVAAGRHVKLIGSVQRHPDGTVTGSVGPVALEPAHPLAQVCGVTNAIAFRSDLLGTVTVAGPGAGRVETAAALISDLTAIHASEQVSAHA